MARINAKLVYSHKVEGVPGELFLRRDPDDVQKWQVIDGKWLTENGKRTGFEVSEIVLKGLAKGGTMEGGARNAIEKLLKERPAAAAEQAA